MRKIFALLLSLLVAPAAAQTIPAGPYGSINQWGPTGLSQVLNPGLAGYCLTSGGTGQPISWNLCPGATLASLPTIATNLFYGNVSGAQAAPVGLDVNAILDTIGYDIARPPSAYSIIYKSLTAPNNPWRTLPPGATGRVLTSGGTTNPPAWLPAVSGSLSTICTTAGAILYFDSVTQWSCLSPGTTGQLLQTNGSAAPSWASFLQPLTGAVARTIQSKLQDTINAADFGAKCDGVTDDTAALNTFFSNLGNISGVGGVNGVLPAGICIFTSALSIPARNDWLLSGQGPATTLKYTGASTTTTLLTIGDGVNTVSRVQLLNFNIDSSTVMTSGQAIRLRKASVYRINGVICGSTTNRLYDGFWADSSNYGNYTNAALYASHYLLTASNGVELDLNNLVMTNAGDTAVYLGGGFGGLYLGEVSIFGQAVGLRVDTTLTGTGNNQIFVSNGTTFDSNTAAGVYLADAVASNKSFSFQGWCASTGVGASGCLVILSFTNGNIQIGGGAQFISNSAAGIYYNDATVYLTLDPAVALSANGTYGINCNVATTKVVSYATAIIANPSGRYSANCNQPLVTAGGPTGSATVAPIITYDAYGRLTAVSSATVTPAVGSITGLGTGVATALGTNIGTAGAFVTFNGALGTPSSGVATNLTGTASGLTAGSATTTNQINSVDQTVAWTTYTPTLSCGTGTLTTSSASGRSRAIGKTIVLQIAATLTTVGTCATSLIATLPATANANFSGVLNGRESALTGNMMAGYIATGGATSVTITKYDGTFAPANGWVVVVSGVYESN